MLRAALLSLGLLFVALTASAQYGPPTPPTANSALGFQPLGKTAALAATTASATVAISVAASQVQVTNPTTGIAFVIFCATSTCTASIGATGGSTSDYPVAAGAVIVMTVPAGYTHVAAVLSTGSGTVYFTPGVGL